MKLIQEFENVPEQNVKTFNTIFRSTPLLGLDLNLPVEIGEPCQADERVIKVGEDTFSLCLIQRKSFKKIGRRNKKLSMSVKECSNCKKEKSVLEFYAHKKSKGGYRAQCKECTIKQVIKIRSGK
jgi:hypothetical protein